MPITVRNVILICIALWDVYTTATGVFDILHNRLFSLVLTCFINGALILTFYPIKKEGDFVITLARIIWILALITDLVTAYTGIVAAIKIPKLDELQKAVIGAFAALTCLGSIGVSFFVIKKEYPPPQ